MKARKKHKYRYVMHVAEEVHHITAIESERKMTYEELSREAERRRVKGELSFLNVSNVDMWCDAAYRDGKEDDDCIAH